MHLDPELAAVLGALALAALLSVPSLFRRRTLARTCGTCGRAVVAGVKTCDCRHRPELR